MHSYPKRLIEVDLPIKTHFCPCAQGEIHPAWAHLHAAYLVGTPAVGSLPGGDLRGALARSGRCALPGILSSEWRDSG